MDRTKHIIAPVAGVITMTLLIFAASANAQFDRTAAASDPSVAAEPIQDLKHRSDPITESFFRMLTHTPTVESKAGALSTESDPLREAIVRALWNTSPAYHVQVQPQLRVVSLADGANG
jgi:hypothetical protein